MASYRPGVDVSGPGPAPLPARVPFSRLTPDTVLDAAEALGLDPDGRLFELNSYENRVYRVGRHEDTPAVLKFYRPGRWSDEQIIEEHGFSAELAARDIAVATPMVLGGLTLHRHAGFRLAAFALHSGVAPELDRADARELLGRTLARIHAVGAQSRFAHRPTMAGSQLGARARMVVLDSPLLPEHMHAAYAEVAADLVQAIEAAFEAAAPVSMIRLHGDCHLGNILWQPRGPLFVDLDDCMNGPRIQDLWMFLSGSVDEQRRQWQDILLGYQQFDTIAHRELALIEPLRAVRMIRHAAWIAERWADPAFPRAFPWAGEARWWESYVGDLRRQHELLFEAPALD